MLRRVPARQVRKRVAPAGGAGGRFWDPPARARFQGNRRPRHGVDRALGACYALWALTPTGGELGRDGRPTLTTEEWKEALSSAKRESRGIGRSPLSV